MGRRNYTKLVFDQLSIDEKSFKKGHQYITVLSHPGSGCVLMWKKTEPRRLVSHCLTE
jgi:hypothetical protein